MFLLGQKCLITLQYTQNLVGTQTSLIGHIGIINELFAVSYCFPHQISPCLFSQVINHELGGGGVEGWTSRESPAEDPGDGSSAGQTEEGKVPETVSAGLPRGCSAKTETKGQCST